MNKQLLEGYKEVKPQYYEKIPCGSRLKYFVDKELKQGGIVKKNMYPDYIVLANYYKKVSWCVQLKEPTLRIWKKV